MFLETGPSTKLAHARTCVNVCVCVVWLFGCVKRAKRVKHKRSKPENDRPEGPKPAENNRRTHTQIY